MIRYMPASVLAPLLAVALLLAACGGARAPETPLPVDGAADGSAGGAVAVQPIATPPGAIATALAATPDQTTLLTSPLAAPEIGTAFDSPVATAPVDTTFESPLAVPPQDRAALEEAIAAKMLELIVTQELGATVADAGEVTAAEITPADELIIWANALPPAAPDAEQTAFDRLPKLDEAAPLEVWVHRPAGQATVRGDAAERAAAIRAYRAATIEADTTADIQQWGLYAFGIVALDEAAGQATVYRDASCGRLCGSGMLYTLTRGADGAWTVTGAENLWIS